MKAPPRWLRRAPLIREPLRKAMKRHAPKGPVAVTVEGVRLSLAPRDNKVDFDIWYKKRLEEAAERDFLAHHMRPGETFIDIGANIGLYPLTVLSAVPDSRAVTFEPLERLRHRQRQNLALNGLLDRVAVRAEAVGPDGTMTLYESDNAGRSSLVPFEGSGRALPVPVRPLADMLAEEGIVPATLKIDVEGFEDRALLPYFDTAPVAAWPRAVVIETLHRGAWQRDCLQELFQRGYQLAITTDENALLTRTDGVFPDHE